MCVLYVYLHGLDIYSGGRAIVLYIRATPTVRRSARAMTHGIARGQLTMVEGGRPFLIRLDGWIERGTLQHQ